MLIIYIYKKNNLELLVLQNDFDLLTTILYLINYSTIYYLCKKREDFHALSYLLSGTHFHTNYDLL